MTLLDSQFSTTPSTALVAQDFATWRKIVSESFVPLDVSTDDEDAFSARIRSRSLGDVVISEIGAKSHCVKRTPQLIADSDRQYFKLSLQLSGTGLLLQDNREAVLQPGDMAIYDTSRPYTLTFDNDFQTLVVMVPQATIDLPRDVIGQLTASRMPGEQGLAKMVGPFLTQIAQNMDELSGHSGVRLMNNALDLITTLLHGELDNPQFELSNNHRSTLLQEIRAFIDENLSEPSLSPGMIAAANFISTRHLHGIFKEEGVTVSSWIRSRRLEHCRRDLADPLFVSKPVSWIAMRWGFVDPSHFSRLFRATYGVAPTDFRHDHLPTLSR